ncbi:ECF transporter S component [uncultured Abiotrophia sp.]|uniref:ECF transporter S component n=1 Tax=uncultured Abiotrophia sp. TaxID=316094 RepID=UPI0028D2395E|nr:ECF transporter S component [uncultured Abiotrophia sp.]
MTQNQRYGSQNKTNQLVKLSVFVALIIIQSWVPMLGNIPTPVLSITYIHVTVILATLCLGWKEGVLVGTAWGLNSWIRALTAPVSPINAQVLSDVMVSVLPRMLMPLILAGLIVVFKSWSKNPRLVGALAGFSGSFLNTFLVLGAIVLFKQEVYMTIKGVDQTGLWQLLGGIIATNGILEAFVAAILTPIFYQVTLQLAKRQGQH